MSRLYNDGSSEPPKLLVYLNLYNLLDLRADSIFPSNLDGIDRDTRLAKDGFQGVQLIDDSFPVPGSALPFCGVDRIDTAQEADAIAAKHVARGDQCLTVHAGWGLEDDDQVLRLVEGILKASDKRRLPIFIETHRSTITQDIWRTVQITKRFPEVRFNGDFSHYYCGQEMVYGGMESKLAFMEPIFGRVGFIHGRIASPGSIQVPIDQNLQNRPRQAHGDFDYLADFRVLWTSAMRGFLKSAAPGDCLIFAPELISGKYYYARLFESPEGHLIEESDRYEQALFLRDLALACFESAQDSLRDRPQSLPL